MKNYLMPMADKIMLRKRFIIETVLDTLKSEMGLEHSRHRLPVNAMVHVLSCLVAYAFRPGKPAISLSRKKSTLIHSWGCGKADASPAHAGSAHGRPASVPLNRTLMLE